MKSTVIVNMMHFFIAAATFSFFQIGWFWSAIFAGVILFVENLVWSAIFQFLLLFKMVKNPNFQDDFDKKLQNAVERSYQILGVGVFLSSLVMSSIVLAGLLKKVILIVPLFLIVVYFLKLFFVKKSLCRPIILSSSTDPLH